MRKSCRRLLAQDALSVAAAAKHTGIGGANIAAMDSVSQVVIVGEAIRKAAELIAVDQGSGEDEAGSAGSVGAPLTIPEAAALPVVTARHDQALAFAATVPLPCPPDDLLGDARSLEIAAVTHRPWRGERGW